MKANGSDRWKANGCVYTSLGGETSEKQEKFARVFKSIRPAAD